MDLFIGWIIKAVVDSIGKLFGEDAYKCAKKFLEKFFKPSVIHVYNYTDNADDNKDGPSPYRGLSHFGPKDKDIFFGRDNIVEKLFNEIVVNKKNFISFVGPSGSGKSSVILAGLVPKLHKHGGWQFTYFRPYYLQDSDPFRDLASALLPFYDLDHSAGKLNLEESAAAHNELTKKLIGYKDNFHEVMKKIEKNYPKNRILVIVDQFEKLYILKNKELRHKFLDCLLSAISNHPSASGPYPLVFLTAVEASGWGEVINDDHSPFKTISWNNQIHLLDMVEDELKEVIEKPAQKYGVKLANGLCNRILRDVNNEPKSLPLLECAMSELWKKREGKAISHTAYQDHKGIKGAVDRYAEKTLGELAANDSSIQNKILHIFLLLVLVYEIDGIKIYKSKPAIKKKDFNEEDLKLIDKLRDARLVVTDYVDSEETVEITHESLFYHWNRLRQMIDENFEFLLKTHQLVSIATDWGKSRGNNPFSLITQPSFNDFEKFFKKNKKFFSVSDLVLVEKYITAGIKKKLQKFFLYIFLWLILPLIVLATVLKIDADRETKNAILQSIEVEKNKRENLEKRLSLGEKMFFYTDFNKKAGVDCFKEKKVCAIKKFNAARKGDPSDPETLIYLNNAKVANYNPLVIAAIVPIGGNKEVAQEILRGVAQAQDDVNKKYLSDCINDETNKSIKDCNKGIKGKPLQIMIGNDDNNKEIAVDIARYLIEEKKEILAVIGHNASEVSTATAKEYQKGKLVMMTPTSFALDFNAISTQNNPRENFIFSIAPNVEHIVPRLVEKMAEKYINKETLEKPKIIICYDQYSFDQKIFRPAFLNYKKTINGEDLSVIEVLDINCDFSEKLDIQTTFENGRKQNADTLFLAPHINRIGDTITVLKTIMQDDRYKHLNIYGSPTLYTNNTLILGEKNVEGLILATGWHPETSEGNFYKDALKKWENKSGITWRTAMAYDTANVIIAGLKKVLKKTDTPSRVALQKEVTSPQFVINGATGKVKFFTECYQKDTDDPRKNELLSECAPGKRDGNTVFLMEIKESKEPRTGYEFGPILSKVKK